MLKVYAEPYGTFSKGNICTDEGRGRKLHKGVRQTELQARILPVRKVKGKGTASARAWSQARGG